MLLNKKKSRDDILDEIEVGRHLKYSHHITPSIISTVNGDYLSIWRIEGRSHQCASKKDMEVWVREFNNTLKGFANENLALWTHVVRRKAGLPERFKYRNYFCKVFDEKYRSKFSDQNLMVNELYITVIYRQNADNVLSLFAKAEKQSKKEKIYRQEKSIRALEDINRQMGGALAKYRPELLKTYDNNGYTYSQPLEFLSYLVNGEKLAMPVCRERFRDYMSLNRPLFSAWGELAEIRLPTKTRYFGMLEVRDYDEWTNPGQLDDLLSAPFEFVLTNSFSMLAKGTAKEYMKRQKKLLEDANDVAFEQADELLQAMNDLMSGRFIMGEHHSTLLCWGDNATEVRDNLGIARAAINNSGVVAGVLDMALEAGFWAQLPCNWSYRPRPAPITSLNFLSFSSFHNYLSGKKDNNPWGPAVTLFKTEAGTPYYFNFHISKINEDARNKRYLGNTFITGRSNTGKTVLLGTIIAQCEKFGITAAIFDKDRGMEILIKAVGGNYYRFEMGKPTGLNPFQLPPTENNKIFLKKFVRSLILSSGEPITHADKEEIGQAVESLMTHIDPEQRNLSMLDQQLFKSNLTSYDERPTVSDRLQCWLRDGEYGWLFDNDVDTLNLDTHPINGFDATEFLTHATVRGPLLEYLTFRTEKNIDGRRFAYIFDELWYFLEDEFFQKLSKNKSKTIRKENGIMVFATQEPNDVLDSPVGKTIAQQCATMILLPNPAANKEDYTKSLKLSDSEFDLLVNLPENSRKFLVRQGAQDSTAGLTLAEGTTLAKLDLSGMEDELLILSGTPDRADMLEKIIEEIGNDDVAIWWPILKRQVEEKNYATQIKN